MPGAPHMFAIGSDTWPGLSKLVEECGEVLQVAGKLMATGGAVDHWDGTNLRQRLIEELGDLGAAITFFQLANFASVESQEITEHSQSKLAIFREWHADAH